MLRSDVPHLTAANDWPTVAMPTPYTLTTCTSYAPGDANWDGSANFTDVSTVLANFGDTTGCSQGDADYNGAVNFTDITAVLAAMGEPGSFTYCTSSLLRFASGEPKHGPSHGHAANESGAIMSASTAAATLSSALLSMGYESIDAFVGTISQMSEADRNAEVRRLGELLEAGAGGVD